MEIVSLTLFTTGMALLFLGYIIVRGSSRLLSSVFYATLLVAAGLWSMLIGLYFSIQDISAMQNIAQAFYAIGMTMPMFMMLFVWSLMGNRTAAVYVLAVLPMMVYSILLLFGVQQVFEVYGPASEYVQVNIREYVVFFTIFGSYFVASMVYLVRYILAFPKDSSLRHRMSYVLLGYGVASAIAVVFNIIMPFLNIHTLIWVGPLGVMLFACMTYYAILYHRLFDVRAEAMRSIGTMAAFITVTSALSFIIPHLDYSSYSIVTAFGVTFFIIMGLIALFFGVRWVGNIPVHRALRRTAYDTKKVLADMSRDLSRTKTTQDVVRVMGRHISRTLKAGYVTLTLESDDELYVYGKPPAFDADTLQKLLHMAKKDVYHFEQGVHYNRVAHLAEQMQLAYVVPLYRGSIYVGTLYIGERTDAHYNEKDAVTLSLMRGELATTLQNIQMIEELSHVNELLEDRVARATKRLRKTNKNLKDMDAAKDEFMSMAGHQLRTPLTSIKGYVSGVLEGDAGEINDLQRMMLEQAFNSTDRLVHLIADLLNLSRIQNNRFVLIVDKANLATMVKDEIEGLQQLSESRKVALHMDTDTTIPDMEVDDNKLRQVIVNFADNALYYTKPGGSVDVRLARDGDDVVYTVKDNGIGVPADKKRRLFHRFFRAENAKSQRPDGTGIGLYLAKRVIDDHGGEIIFESVEGKGSTFGFRLPIVRAKTK